MATIHGKRAAAIRRRRVRDMRPLMAAAIDSLYVTNAKGKGYDLDMIRDFHTHLFLEVDASMLESVEILRQLLRTKDLNAAVAAVGDLSATVSKQLKAYRDKYECALLPSVSFDADGVTEEEVARAMRLWCEATLNRREKQIGHLDALQSLLRIALTYAEAHSQVMPDGSAVLPWQSEIIRGCLRSDK